MNKVIKFSLCLILSYVLSFLGFIVAAKVVAFLATAFLLLNALKWVLVTAVVVLVAKDISKEDINKD